ncbi:hypothetical protein HYX03_01505 [Candidatus Woesearchaeota archaeon]|nr:hypothetical protein [Candidatus Woesearchaeota archaeon]
MGLADFFSILAFALIIFIFYLLLRFTINKSTIDISAYSSNVESSISLINILRTPIKLDGVEMNIAELIALQDTDSTKKDLVEKTITRILDNYFGSSSCSIMCIDEAQYKGNGCDNSVMYGCPTNSITMPSHTNKLIKVYFESNMQQPYSQLAP